MTGLFDRSGVAAIYRYIMSATIRSHSSSPPWHGLLKNIPQNDHMFVQRCGCNSSLVAQGCCLTPAVGYSLPASCLWGLASNVATLYFSFDMAKRSQGALSNIYKTLEQAPPNVKKSGFCEQAATEQQWMLLMHGYGQSMLATLAAVVSVGHLLGCTFLFPIASIALSVLMIAYCANVSIRHLQQWQTTYQASKPAKINTMAAQRPKFAEDFKLYCQQRRQCLAVQASLWCGLAIVFALSLTTLSPVLLLSVQLGLLGGLAAHTFLSNRYLVSHWPQLRALQPHQLEQLDEKTFEQLYDKYKQHYQSWRKAWQQLNTLLHWQQKAMHLLHKTFWGECNQKAQMVFAHRLATLSQQNINDGQLVRTVIYTLIDDYLHHEIASSNHETQKALTALQQAFAQCHHQQKAVATLEQDLLVYAEAYGESPDDTSPPSQQSMGFSSHFLRIFLNLRRFQAYADYFSEFELSKNHQPRTVTTAAATLLKRSQPSQTQECCCQASTQ